MGNAVPLKPPHIEIAEKRIAELQEQGLISFSEIGAFAQVFADLERNPPADPIQIESDISPPDLGGHVAIGADITPAQMRKAMEEIGGELTNYLLREGYIVFTKFNQPGKKIRLRGMLLVVAPPKQKKQPTVKAN